MVELTCPHGSLSLLSALCLVYLAAKRRPSSFNCKEDRVAV
jgi:hypothetical protein